MVLQMIFGMTLTSVSDYIEYGTRILTNLLLESEDVPKSKSHQLTTMWKK